MEIQSVTIQLYKESVAESIIPGCAAKRGGAVFLHNSCISLFRASGSDEESCGADKLGAWMADTDYRGLVLGQILVLPMPHRCHCRIVQKDSVSRTTIPSFPQKKLGFPDSRRSPFYHLV